jgi:hypothetical protein
MRECAARSPGDFGEPRRESYAGAVHAISVQLATDEATNSECARCQIRIASK